MKRNILTLVCLSLAMWALADEPQYAIEELLGAKIASVDAYNFEWNDSTGTARINESACAMMGKYCTLTSSSSSPDVMYISYFYGDFTIPLQIDLATGVVTIKACQPLCIMYSYSYPNSRESKSLTATEIDYWTLYAVPYSWVTGDGDCGEYIYGQVNEDSTITFNDDFAFLVQKHWGGDSVSWGLSPIFKNLTLLTPNGTHGFDYTRLEAAEDIGPVGHGHGGLVPRPNNPGASKPVSPRPISSIIGANNPSSNNNRFNKDPLHFQDLLQCIVLWPAYETLGYGGLVPVPPGKPGSSKPKSTGPFDDYINGGDTEINISPVLKTSFNQQGKEKTTHELVPVYWKMVDDTTLMVYNLFGMGMRCHMKIDKNNETIYLPRQKIYNDGLGRIMINQSCSGTWSQDGAITWEETSCYLTNIGSYPKFESNVLQFSGDSPFTVPLEPEFAEPVVTDTTVKFYATPHELNGMEVILYLFDEEDYEYFEVVNPLTLPRLDEAYWITLAAIAYNPNTGVYSDFVWADYEVPALEYMLGDVNNDRDVDISDVTSMIDGLLTDNWDGKNYNNADCNEDGSVDISDVTFLIDYLLSGSWAK